MAKLRSSNIEPSTATTLALGASSDSILISSDSLKANTWQDLGGNSLFVSDGSGSMSNINSGLKGGGYTLISTHSTIATSVSSIAITSGIDSTYDEYAFVITDFHPSNDGIALQIEFSTNGGSSYGISKMTTSWKAHQVEAGGSTLAYSPDWDRENSTSPAYVTTAEVGNQNKESASGIFRLFTPSNTTYVKQFFGRMNEVMSNPGSVDYFKAGWVDTTSAIDAVQFTPSAGTIDNVVIQMYGVS